MKAGAEDPSPAPVRITTHTRGSCSVCATTVASDCATSLLMALRASGRLIVMPVSRMICRLSSLKGRIKWLTARLGSGAPLQSAGDMAHMRVS